MEEWFDTVIVKQAPGIGPALARAALFPLSITYGAAIEFYKLLFRMGVLRTVRLPCRVVSVGNLTMGGVGKTVAVQALATALEDAGYRCAILSYGFRAEHEGPYGIVSDRSQALMSAREAGDEAFLLAASLPGVPVLIGKRRPVSGKVALERFQPDVIVLDDAFQHWRLYRDIDLVLLDARDPLGNGRLFPAGLLRESPRSLGRATACILTRADRCTDVEIAASRRRVHSLAPRAAIHETRHQLGPWYRVRPGSYAAGEPEPWRPEAGERLFVVSGIGQNQSFYETIRNGGVPIGGALAYPDHHLYTTADVGRILREASGCSSVVTTEKDAVKLTAIWPDGIPLLAAPVHLDGISPAEWLTLCGFDGPRQNSEGAVSSVPKP